MNKDLDERLVPNGEYRDAMNIQVSTSEGSDVGTAQNILGNSEITGQSGISSSAICVGAVADEKSDKLYWFVRDRSATAPFDGIFEYSSNGTIKPVLIDTNLNVLKFSENKIITGINIIDDMLFWTDNQNEPKVINIPRSITGTNVSGALHTDFINDKRIPELSVPIREEHITVIKKHPTTAPTVKLSSERSNDQGKIYSGVMRITSEPEYLDGPTTFDGYSIGQVLTTTWNDENESSMWFPRSIYNYHYDFSKLSVGDYFDTYIETDINGESGFSLDWETGDTLLFQAFGGKLYDQPPSLPLRDYSVKARIRYKDQYAKHHFYWQTEPNYSGDTWNPKDLADDDPIALGDTPREFTAIWKEGEESTRFKLTYGTGFDGRIGEIHIYEVVNGIVNVGVDLCPNPEFKDTGFEHWSVLGSNGCFDHGVATDRGAQYSTNPNYVDDNGNGPTTASPVAGNGQPAYIDPAKFPCMPSNFYFSHHKDGTPEVRQGYGPWHINHSDTPSEGFAQAGGRGKNSATAQTNATGDNNYGAMIHYPLGVNANKGYAVSIPNSGGGTPYGSGGNGFDNWKYLANDLPITGADGNTYNSYDALNQRGTMVINMSSSNCPDPYDYTTRLPNTPCYAKGGTYQAVYTILDSGHTYGWYGENGPASGTMHPHNATLIQTDAYVNPWNNPNYFEDAPLEIIKNGNFIEPDADGNLPKYWVESSEWRDSSYSPHSSILYLPEDHYVELGRRLTPSGDRIPFGGDGQYTKLNVGIPLKIENDQTYEFSFELSDIGIDSQGIICAIVGENFAEDYWESTVANTEGINTFVITTTSGTGIPNSGLSGGDRFFFQSPSPGLLSSSNPGFIGRIHNISVKRISAPNANVTCEVLAIHNPPTATEGNEIRFAVDLESTQNKIFEFKFPRFAYRYQYGDNEYSSMSPFSTVAFIPGKFIYHPKEGFNLGMTNRLIEANIKGFMERIPDGVIAIDILYKDDKSPEVYIVDTIKPKHTALSNSGNTIWNLEEYTISSEQINSMLTSNQLLRPWDAVPLKALGQDVSGSRIIYGNYVQGFDLQYAYQSDEGVDTIEEYYPDFNFDILSSDNLDFTTEKSVKSLREYQLGIVFADKYGRETPVVSNFTGTKALEKQQSKRINQLQVGFDNVNFPQNMEYFKFFVKETSNEYYNLAMDRWYDAEDGGAWLAFPSSDRNKVDIDTFLILKKATDSNVGVIDETRYKVLDVQDNVPEFVRQNRKLISSNIHNFVDSSTPSIFGNGLGDAPLSGESSFKMNYKPYFNTSGSDLHKIENANLFVDFKSTDGNITERYRISKITCDYIDGDVGTDVEDAQYSIVLDGGFGDEVDLITDDPLTGLNPTKIKDGTTVNIYEYAEEDLARFGGRFFAKISIDADFNEQLLVPEDDLAYRTVESKKLYYLSSDKDLHDTSLTGQSAGSYTNSTYGGGFGQFAPFFRNYNRPANYISVPLIDSSGADGDVGAFVFGNDLPTDRPWLKELAWITTNPNQTFNCPSGVMREDILVVDGNDTSGAGDFWPGVKVADKHGFSNKQKIDGEFNKKGEQVSGDVWFIDGGNYIQAVSEAKKLQWIKDDPSGGLNSTQIITDNNPMNAEGVVDGDQTQESYSTFDISVGTVYNKQVQFSSITSGSDPLAIDNFWNIGRKEHTEDILNDDTYQGLEGLVNQIQPGKKFRFRQDPTGEIYTIQQDVEEINRVRWGTVSAKIPGQYTNNQFEYGWKWYSPRDIGTTFQETLSWRVNRYPGTSQHEHPNPATTASALGTEKYFKDTTASACTNYGYSTHVDFSKQLSPNFTKTWKPKVVNSEGKPNINWNPATGILGPIDNGLELEIFHSGEAAVAASDASIYVNVDSLEGTDINTGVTHNITVGMIMVSHSDAATNCVFDGSDGIEFLAIHEIEEIQSPGGLAESFKLHLTGYSRILVNDANNPLVYAKHLIYDNIPVVDQKMVFAQPTMNGYSQYSVNRINHQDPAVMGWTGPTIVNNTQTDSGNPGIMAIGYNLDFIELIDLDANLDTEMSENPAIWETEPKEAIDLELYHEASGYYPLEANNNTVLLLTPLGSIVETVTGVYIEPGTTISAAEVDANGDIRITLSSPSDYTIFGDKTAAGGVMSLYVNGVLVSDASWQAGDPGPYVTVEDRLRITRPNGEIVIVTIKGWEDADLNGRTSTFIVSGDLYGPETSYILNWHNCYSFGNGVESNRIRDNFNLPFISNGPKVSTTLEGNYNREHRKYGLIYSGLYNSNSSVNNLNQFIAAEKITKDINPIYGSIQKLHSRDSDLVVLCEDKCLRILANKDALFNADGNTNLTATSNVLGQTIPFSGEYGISTNPESFASESYRVYFTDKVRGAVMRLSKDGLTPISMYGMSDWFKDNLKLSTKLIGSYDDKKEEYNITLDNSTDGLPKTVSYKENVKGWVSFKSFVPEFGLSMANNYYTTKLGRLYEHHKEIANNRNTFYGDHTYSSVKILFNEGSGSIKSFHTLNYEGSQSKIDQVINQTSLTFQFQNNDLPTDYNNQEYYNLTAKQGWYASSIITDKDNGYVTNFIEKEGEWFAQMNKRIDTTLSVPVDTSNFSFQGIGLVSSTVISGCTDPTALNYDALANIDDGSCVETIQGCIDVTADNYDALANFDDGSCVYTVEVLGCTDDGSSNYNSSANTNDGSCIDCVYGCIDPIANNTDASATCDDGSCTYDVDCNGDVNGTAVEDDCGVCGGNNDCYGCTDPSACNYDTTATLDDGSCILPDGCNDPLYVEYDANVTCSDPNDCINLIVNGCTDVSAINYNASANTDDGTCTYPISGCTDPIACNYDSNATVNDGSCGFPDTNADCLGACLAGFIDVNGACVAEVFGCMDVLYLEYDASANVDDGSCSGGNGTLIVLGCTNLNATNYDALANVDDGSCSYPALAIGDTFAGGIIFYFNNGYTSVADGSGNITKQANTPITGGLVVYASDIANLAMSNTTEWGCYGVDTGAIGTAIGTGNQNTLDILASCSVTPIAASIVSDHTSGGYTDWFLPSSGEFVEMADNLGNFSSLTPTSGINTNGDTLSNIANLESMTYYWTSTENVGNPTTQACMCNGFSGNTPICSASKNSVLNVRPIRAF